jgi:hypothetical protein
MVKLINGQPMSELKRDGRLVLIRNDTRIYTGHAYEATIGCEWAEILAPEPKPDANGWWNFSEKRPDQGQEVMRYHKASDTFDVSTFHPHEIRYWHGCKWQEIKPPAD